MHYAYNFFDCHKGLDKQNFEHKIVNVSLPISFNMCFGCSKEPFHLDGSFEYPQHMLWLRNKKIILWYSLVTKGLLPYAHLKTV